MNIVERILSEITPEELTITENKMRKEIKIAEAYGEDNYQILRELINEDGWCFYNERDKIEVGAEVPNTYDYDVEFDPPYGYYWRPKSLNNK